MSMDLTLRDQIAIVNIILKSRMGKTCSVTVNMHLGRTEDRDTNQGAEEDATSLLL